MPPDEARLQDVRAWLLKAELDLKAAAHEMAAPTEGLWGDVMFHAQQAAEKAMKALHGTTCRFARRTISRNSASSAWNWTQPCEPLPVKQRP